MSSLAGTAAATCARAARSGHAHARRRSGPSSRGCHTQRRCHHDGRVAVRKGVSSFQAPPRPPLARMTAVIWRCQAFRMRRCTLLRRRRQMPTPAARCSTDNAPVRRAT